MDGRERNAGSGPEAGDGSVTADRPAPDPGWVVGVDEAGKGPALGSMFAAAVAVPDPSVLPDGLDDSKNLSPARRTELSAALRADDRVRIGVAEITPDRIDDPATDMNSLTVAAQATAVDAVAVDGMAAILDAGDTSEDRFARRVADGAGTDVAVTAEHGADETHAVVSAASIVAKVDRDAQMDRLADDHGAVGSGYPGDPVTREFLRTYVDDHGRLPPFARASWATCEDVLSAAEQSTIEEF